MKWLCQADNVLWIQVHLFEFSSRRIVRDPVLRTLFLDKPLTISLSLSLSTKRKKKKKWQKKKKLKSKCKPRTHTHARTHVHTRARTHIHTHAHSTFKTCWFRVMGKFADFAGVISCRFSGNWGISCRFHKIGRFWKLLRIFGKSLPILRNRQSFANYAMAMLVCA